MSLVCGASLVYHLFSVAATSWQTWSFQTICLWSRQGPAFMDCSIKPKPLQCSGCRVVISESAGEHGTTGSSTVGSSGPDNGLGAPLEHRYLCPRKYMHMVCHLITAQEFTQYLILWLVLGLPQWTTQTQSMSSWRSHTQSSLLLSKSGWTQQWWSFLRVSSQCSGTAWWRDQAGAEYLHSSVGWTTVVRCSVGMELRNPSTWQVDMLKASSCSLLDHCPVSGAFGPNQQQDQRWPFWLGAPFPFEGLGSAMLSSLKQYTEEAESQLWTMLGAN